MQFDIELSFNPGAAHWLEAFLAPDGSALCHFPSKFLRKVSLRDRATFLREGGSEYIGFVEKLKLFKDGGVELLILTGSEGPELIERVMARLYGGGCIDLSAFLYSDECEYVEGEDGLEHRCGLHYFFAEGCLQCQDYPEILNQYY